MADERYFTATLKIETKEAVATFNDIFGSLSNTVANLVNISTELYKSNANLFFELLTKSQNKN